MGWQDYPSAPAPGTVICAADDVTGVHALTVATGKGDFPILVARSGNGFCAYVNACPHQYLPLDYRGRQLQSADGTMILCTNHGARFDLATGVAVDGADCGLDRVPVECAAGVIRIAVE
ncbi:Rieske (2Fe-2S) protein [Paracoccus sp. (in: a-proteobacteria)]|uniref:Rieske (2Fe-2S) protein n=1 Tax=Paracoccus sp. TaxID=267 RepID=UPI003A855AA1